MFQGNDQFPQQDEGILSVLLRLTRKKSALDPSCYSADLWDFWGNQGAEKDKKNSWESVEKKMNPAPG